jgi:hypothetical protein
LFLGFGPASIPMGGVGMTGCSFNLDPVGPLIAFPTTTGTGATGALVTIPLPDNPPFFGDIYFQWLFVQGGLNPAQLGTTPGLRAQVR